MPNAGLELMALRLRVMLHRLSPARCPFSFLIFICIFYFFLSLNFDLFLG